MRVSVEYTCPVSVIVDTDTGTVEQVVVWDESLDTGTPTAVRRDEYVRDTNEAPVGEFPHGRSIFEPLPDDAPERATALAIVADGDIEWPAWGFGS